MTLEQKVRDRHARGQFNSHNGFLFLFFSFSFLSPVFFFVPPPPPPPYPLPLPTPIPFPSPPLKIFFPPKTKLRGYSTGYRLVIIILLYFALVWGSMVEGGIEDKLKPNIKGGEVILALHAHVLLRDWLDIKQLKTSCPCNCTRAGPATCIVLGLLTPSSSSMIGAYSACPSQYWQFLLMQHMHFVPWLTRSDQSGVHEYTHSLDFCPWQHASFMAKTCSLFYECNIPLRSSAFCCINQELASLYSDLHSPRLAALACRHVN